MDFGRSATHFSRASFRPSAFAAEIGYECFFEYSCACQISSTIWIRLRSQFEVFDSNTPDIGLSSGRSILSSVLDRKTGLSHPIGCFENNKE
jgi:hypothetical protein